MAFKVLLLGADSEIMQPLKARVDGQPWVSVVCGEAFSVDSEDAVAKYFAQAHPSVVVGVLPDDELQRPNYLSQLANVAAVCAATDTPIIQLSTYHELITPPHSNEEIHEVDDGFSYVNESVELLVSKVKRHLILRRSWLLDGKDLSLLAKLSPSVMAGEEIVVSDHDFGSPVSMGFIADAIVAIIQQILNGADNWGVFHLRSGDSCSEAEFCDQLVRQLRKEMGEKVLLPTVAPKDDLRRFLVGNANLVGRRITDDFGIQLPTWRRGFGRMLREWLEQNSEFKPEP